MGLGGLARGLLNAGTAQAEGQQQGALQARQLAMMAQEIAMQNELRRAQAAEAEGRGNLYNAQATNVPTPWERYGVPSTIRGITAGAHDQALTTIGAGHDVARVTAAKTAAGARTKAQADQDARDHDMFVRQYALEQLRPHYDPISGQPVAGRQFADVVREAEQAWQIHKGSTKPVTGSGAGGPSSGGTEWNALKTPQGPGNAPGTQQAETGYVPRTHQEVDRLAAQAAQDPLTGNDPQKIQAIKQWAQQQHQRLMSSPGQTVVPGPSAGAPVPPGGPDEDEDEPNEAQPQ